MLQSGDGLQKLPLSAARNAGDTQYLPGTCRKGHIAENGDALLVETAQSLDRQPLDRIHRRPPLDVQLHLFANHHLGQLRLGGMRRLNRGNMLTLAQDGYPVGDCHDLMQLVRDDDDCLALGAHDTEDIKQSARLLRRQNRGRLVQNQNIHASVQYLDDLDRLLLGDRHLVYLLGRLQTEAIPLGDFLDPPVHRIHGKPSRFRYTQHDVLRRRKHVHQLEVLMDHADAVPEGILRGAYLCFPAPDADTAFIRIVNTRDHVHQGGLAASVLPQNGKNLPVVHRQIHIPVCLNGAEVLGYALQLNCRRFAHAHTSVVFVAAPRVAHPMRGCL